MCSPSRATLLTGRYPAEHGVTLTLTAADLRPDLRHSPAVISTMLGLMRSGEAPRSRVMRGFTRGLFQAGPKSGGEPELPTGTPNLARLLGDRGYHVAYRGKWHLTHPGATEAETGLLAGWGPADAGRIERDYGFRGWEPPDAGENAKAEHFGGGNAGPLGLGWDEEYTRQAERFLSDPGLPEPFCLVVSLVNPHDVLGYPASHRRGGYSPADLGDLGVELPPTVDEDLSGKPGTHALMRMGMNAYLGPLRTRAQKHDYVNFYAHLHRVVDEKLGRILAALGDAGNPGSLRSRTVIVRTADHGEMGLSHGGLRQKAFNAYEETIHIPLVVSNPVLFPQPARTDAFASLVDLVPTMLTAAGTDQSDRAREGLRGVDLAPVIASRAAPEREALREAPVDLSPIVAHRRPADSVQEAIHFTYDDHQAATALQDVSGQPNRIRCVRTARHKYAYYFDPAGKAPTEFEMYDLERDPEERRNLVHLRTGNPRDGADAGARDELAELLDEVTEHCGTAPGA